MMTAFLVRLGLSPKMARWLGRAALAIAIVAACASIFDAGYSAGRDALQAKVNQEKLAAERAARLALHDLRRRNDQLTRDLNAASQSDRIIYRTIREKVPHVIQQVREIPVESARDCSVSRGFVWLWDDAIVGRVPGTTGSTAHGPARAGDPAAPAGVGFGELLDNHVDNAEVANDVRRQCQALIDWHRANDP